MIDPLVDLPTVLPPAVAGVALLMAFGRNGLLGGVLADLGLEIAFSPAAVVLALWWWTFPKMFLSKRPLTAVTLHRLRCGHTTQFARDMPDKSKKPCNCCFKLKGLSFTQVVGYC